MGDKVDEAIAKVETPPDVKAMAEQLSKLVQLQININSTGRIVMLAVPPDLTEPELLEFIGWSANPIGGLRAALPQKSAIQIARALPGNARPT